jgi:hypothetical protein
MKARLVVTRKIILLLQLAPRNTEMKNKISTSRKRKVLHGIALYRHDDDDGGIAFQKYM